jgi:hypothetical protein
MNKIFLLILLLTLLLALITKRKSLLTDTTSNTSTTVNINCDYLDYTQIKNNTCIVLTTCVNSVNSTVQNSKSRLNIYLNVINKYLKYTVLTIYVVESSLYTFPEFKGNNRVIISSFKSKLGNKSSSILEAESLFFIFKEQLLSKYSRIVKITGRYYVPGLANMINSIPENADLFLQHTRNDFIKFQNSEIFGCKTKYFDIICNQIITCPDHINMEHILYYFYESKKYSIYRFPQVNLCKSVNRGGDTVIMRYL